MTRPILSTDHRAAPAAVPDPIDVTQALRVLWRDRVRLLAVLAVFLGLGTYCAFFAVTPLYQASSVVILDPREEQVLGLDGVLGGLTTENSVVRSEVEVMRSRSLLGQVVRDLRLGEDPEFNGRLKPPDRIAAHLAALRGWLGRPVATPPPQTRLQGEAAAISALSDRLTVENVPLSLVFRISVLSEDPEKSAAIADAIARRYVQGQLDLKAQATRRAAAWLEERVAALQVELEKAEARLADFNGEHDLMPIATLRAMEEALRELKANGAPTARIAALEAGIDQRGGEHVTLQNLVREVEASRGLYEHFLLRLKETAVQEGVQEADSRILSKAVPPRMPERPRKSLILGLAGLVGLTLGSVLVLWADAATDRFRSGRDLAEHVAVPIWGQVLRVPGRGYRAVLNHLADNPASVAAESLRNLRTSLFHARPGDGPRVILVTSSMPDEGKTTLALSLAQSLAGQGKAVLVIDADLRRPSVGRLLDRRAGPGLAEVLQGQEPEAALVDDPLTGAALLPAGNAPRGRAADLLTLDRVSQVLGTLRDSHDVILIDTPPVHLVPDARILAKQADAILVAVRWNHTTRAQLEETLGQLDLGRDGRAGVALTRVNPRGARRYDLSGRYGAYSRAAGRYYG
ncbi:MAG: AAA family ATPase [Rhodobacteraceae bacterium]|nr:AAA family ATPase [Paracoccaceae bacterium]